MEKMQKKIMVFGTFDGLHQGHLNLFEQARNLADKPYLIVSIARDVNVRRIKKIKTLLSERERLLLLASCKLVDKAILGGVKNHIAHIVKEAPEIIALGYDQTEYVKNLKKDLQAKGLKVRIVRLKPYKDHIYKNHLLKQKRKV